MKSKLFETIYVCPKCNLDVTYETDYKITKLPKCNRCGRRLKKV